MPSEEGVREDAVADVAAAVALAEEAGALVALLPSFPIISFEGYLRRLRKAFSPVAVAGDVVAVVVAAAAEVE